MRPVLQAIDIAVPIAGVLLVRGAVLFVLQLRLLALVVAGLLLVQVGARKSG